MGVKPKFLLTVEFMKVFPDNRFVSAGNIGPRIVERAAARMAAREAGDGGEDEQEESDREDEETERNEENQEG